MKKPNSLCKPILLAIIFLLSPITSSADMKTIGIYKIVPGKQQAFMEWMAAWDEVYKTIGLEQPQWYRNVRGDDWDFVVLYPPFDASKEAEMEKVGKARGLAVGFEWKLQYWQFVQRQTESLSYGPTTPAALLQSLKNQ
ncbi:hypothetical protein NO559_08550 [Dasania sp. GY-MA-18]|uniref:NIPSNAP domain-containing protein n=1 Tax=Dasania phycosphaerae TaxID=2950436 RepID=A0A9J6RLP9_9GAMM|nr:MULTISPECIES: hypothetical protein [Dasania]MCR8922818.1 hypothetical protein [Dasania sp. GY-MA-18]MCZ0865249.1 hypothetical protein [Dasania phycosphaerae]MCZ0868974.1 hypothetical protein [Dasania phycosphaerae]